MRAFAKAPSAESTTRGNGSTFPLGVLAVTLACAAAFLGIGAPAAGAATPGSSFAPLSPTPTYFGSKQLEPQTGPDSNALNDVVVGPPEDSVYVALSQDGYIARNLPVLADPGGEWVEDINGTATGWDSVNIAIDQSDGTIYVGDRGIFGVGMGRMVSDGATPPTYTADPSFAPPGFSDLASFAVDPATGNVIAVDPAAGLIYRLSTTGEVLSSFDGSGALQSPTATAVGPDGTIYVVDGGDGGVQRFTSSGSPDGTVALPDGAVAEVLAVEPASGDLAVVVRQGQSRSIEGYDDAGQHLFSAGLPSSLSATHGLAWGSAGERIYVSRGRGEVLTLERVLQAGIDAPEVVSSDRNTAHVSVAVATGGQPTNVRLEYCAAVYQCSQYSSSDPSDPHNPWVRGPIHAELQGSGEETVEDDLPLTSNEEWQIRAVATNERISNTSDVTTFASPLVSPVSETRSANSVSETEAVLNGMIDAIGSQTTYHFEYGVTEAYGDSVPVGTEASAGAGHLVRAVSKTISSLQPGTTYHYRLVASNAAGTTEGADRTFTTLTPGQSPPARAYEQVTPVDKRGASVRFDFHYAAKADGSAFAPAVSAAASDADSSNLISNYVTYRGSEGWSSWQPTDPPLNAAVGIFEANTAAISDDFQHALVISNRALAPGGIEGGGNLYVRDLRDDTYTFVVGSSDPDAYRGLSGAGLNTTILIEAAPDFSWIVFNWTRLINDPVGTAVYRWSRTEGLERVSVMPDGTPSPIRTQQYSNGTQKWASEDGKIVYFGLEGGAGGAIYRRADGQTTLLSSFMGFPMPARLDGVSRDGRYAIFHVSQFPVPLTPDTPPGDFGIYRYDSQSGELTYLSSGVAGAYPIGGISDDGETVYLETSDPAGRLKVWHEGVLQTVAATSGEDHSMSTTPSGRYFVWAEGDGSAHLYDRETGQAVCVSCPADGSKAGAGIPNGKFGNRLPKVVTEDGTVFFETAARLVTADHNGSNDVYEYKGGRLTLISPGDGNFDAHYLDVSDNGHDVFFATEEGLVGQDVDGAMDVYDARVGGGFASQSPLPGPTPCVRAECGETGSASPPGPPIATGSGREGSSGPAIGGVKPLGARDRARLARGKGTQLKVTVTRPGTVKAIGTAMTGGRKSRVISSSVQARVAGAVSVPISLSQRGLSALRRSGALRVRLTVSSGGTSKAVSFTLKSPGSGKGGRS